MSINSRADEKGLSHDYRCSEATLGKRDAMKTFKIQTKAPALAPGSPSKQSILNGMAKSLRDLGTDRVCLLNPSAMGRS